MSLLDNVRQTLGEAASNAREMGQNLSAQAQSQIAIKKLQLEHTKKLRDLGEKTFAWYQSGQMIVTGQVPADVRALCVELDESSTRLRLEEARLEEWKQQAAARNQSPSAPSTFSVLPNTEEDTAMNYPTTHDTQKLSDTTPASSNASTHSGVTMPGTNIVTNPTSTNDTEAAATHGSATPRDSAPEPKTEGDVPLVPVSDLAPSPSGEVSIGGGTMPGAPGTSDTMGNGIGGGSFGGTM